MFPDFVSCIQLRYYVLGYTNYDVDTRLDKIQMICGTIDRIFRNQVRRETKLKVLQSYGQQLRHKKVKYSLTIL